MLASSAFEKPNVIIDTLADFDRGFFRRYGVVDRLYNPRLGFHVARHLNGAINNDLGPLSEFEVMETKSYRIIHMQHGDGNAALILPNKGIFFADLKDELSDQTDPTYLNLASGSIEKTPPVELKGPLVVLS